jgi:hypothetical protein
LRNEKTSMNTLEEKTNNNDKNNKNMIITTAAIIAVVVALATGPFVVSSSNLIQSAYADN